MAMASSQSQATRLNLRMQKELKLLLTDPPPGVSFPTLSDNSSSAFSLTSIDALLQGPEGTVYADGVFKIKIQIPERYPFQPPIVTFATPIYHPNIDNGGRICLDILNLPPKGMWQPSLNISTVLTSIGLLLSEPNPDDGLMHEASRDYKYNRQAFDQNARSMTEKCARAQETESDWGSHWPQAHTGQSTAQTRVQGSDASTSMTEHRKLLVGSLGSSSNDGDSGEEIHGVQTHGDSKSHIEFGTQKEADNYLSKYTGNLGRLETTRNKLSLKLSIASHSRNGESENTSLQNHYSSLLEIQTTSRDSPESSLLVQIGSTLSNRDEDHTKRSHNKSVIQEKQSLHCVGMGQSRNSDEKLQSVPQRTVSQLDTTKPQEGFSCSLSTSLNKTNPHKDVIARNESCSTGIRLKKVGPVGLIPSLGPSGCSQNYLIDEKENLAPIQCVMPQLTGQYAASAIISSVSENGVYCSEKGKQAMIGAPTPGTAVKLPLKPVDQPLGSSNNMTLHCENLQNPHSKYLHLTDNVISDKKQQIDQVCTDKFKLAKGEGSLVPEAVIVLDSEDSEDEIVPVRSKLSLAKRCLSRKRKSGF